jgi:TfoX/Sxy family transcriptional regulator of competence genes
MAVDGTIVARIRELLSGRGDVLERRMMGGICFMVGGHMCCGASGKRLMVRVGREAYAGTLLEPNVRPLDLGGRHPLGYVLVDAAGIREDSDLRLWLDRGIAAVEALPAKNRSKTSATART